MRCHSQIKTGRSRQPRRQAGGHRRPKSRKSKPGQLSLGVSGGRRGRRTCLLDVREFAGRVSGCASAAISDLVTGGLGSPLGPAGLGPDLRGSVRLPRPWAPWRLSGCLSEGRSDSRFPGARVISISMISSHCSSVRSRSGMARSSRSRRRGSWGSESFMATL